MKDLVLSRKIYSANINFTIVDNILSSNQYIYFETPLNYEYNAPESQTKRL